MIMVVMMLMFVIVVVIVMVMVVTALVVVIVVIVVMVVMVLMFVIIVVIMMVSAHRADTFFFKKLCHHVVLLFHSLKDRFAADLIPRGCNEHCVLVVLTDELDCFLLLLLIHNACSAEDYGSGMFDLIVEELTEVLHVHLALCNVYYGNKVINRDACLFGNIINRSDNVRKLADARGLDDDSIGLEFVLYLNKCLSEITDKCTADTTGVKLVDRNACVFEESRIDSDLAEFVLDEYELLALVGLIDQFLDKCGLSCSEESRKNINFCHLTVLLTTFIS